MKRAAASSLLVLCSTVLRIVDNIALVSFLIDGNMAKLFTVGRYREAFYVAQLEYPLSHCV